MLTSAQRITVEDFRFPQKFFFFDLKIKIYFEIAKSFEIESMSLYVINFIIDMLGKLDKLG